MRSKFGIGMFALASIAAGTLAFAAELPPPWAYGFPGPPPAAPQAQPDGARASGAAAPAPDTSLKSVPASPLQFTLAQIRDGFGPADWFPDDHPRMPDIVAHGRRPDVRACSLCHYPNGKGRAENAGVSGLPVEYFVHTMYDFRNGNRRSADPRKANTNVMITIAKAMTDDEIKARPSILAR
jgi:cytochrome c553